MASRSRAPGHDAVGLAAASCSCISGGGRAEAGEAEAVADATNRAAILAHVDQLLAVEDTDTEAITLIIENNISFSRVGWTHDGIRAVFAALVQHAPTRELIDLAERCAS